MTTEPDRKRRHRCMRCNEIFDCEHGDGCAAKFDVLPVIVLDGNGATREHCPEQPDWSWIRAYGERMYATGVLTQRRPISELKFKNGTAWDGNEGGSDG